MALPEILITAFEENRLSDSYLFFGRETQFYRSLIINFFKRIACQQKTEEFCGSCVDCKQMESFTHPDFVAPGESKEESKGDAGENLGVGDVRSKILESASLTPARSDRKLFWLNNPDRFTPEASNAMLKVLEEPPGKALFVITARSRWDCLPTVRSRCQWIRFEPSYEQNQDLYDQLECLWPKQSINSGTLEDWIQLIEGNQSAYEISWKTDQARLFLGFLIVLVNQKYTNRETDRISKKTWNKLSYRLIDPILDRLNELDQGGKPDIIVNSILEEIFMPGEQKEWVNTI